MNMLSSARRLDAALTTPRRYLRIEPSTESLNPEILETTVTALHGTLTSPGRSLSGTADETVEVLLVATGTPGPTDELPDPVARLMRGREAVQWADAGGLADAGEEEITGHGASPGTVRGPAGVITGPDEFDEIFEGDILVAEAKSSAFNTFLPLLGGIVTDKGGMLSHPAIVAREFGIPGVVGCDVATNRIEDRDTIVVDGDAGVVRVAQ